MANPRRATYTGNGTVDRNFQMILNILDELKPVNPKAKNANIIQTNEGIDISQNISTQGTPSFSKVGAGVAPTASQVFTIKDKQDIGTRTFDTSWRTGSGWGVIYENNEYTAYFDNIQINGNLRAKTFILDELRLNNGDEIWSNAGKVLRTDGVSWFDVEDPNENLANPFVANDVIECRLVNMTGATFIGGEIVGDEFLIKRLIFKVTSVSGLRVYVTMVSGAPTNVNLIQIGDVFVRQYNETNASRRGSVGIYATGENNPYIEVRDGANSWATHRSDERIYFRAGKLDGVNLSSVFPELDGTQTNTYGTIIKGNAYIQGNIVMDNQSSIFIGDFAGTLDDIDDGSTYVKISTTQEDKLNGVENGATNGASWNSNLTNIPATLQTPSGTGLFLSSTNLGYYDGSTWKTYMDNTGNFYLGGTSGSLTWDAGTNLLVITNGSIISPDISGASISAGDLSIWSGGLVDIGSPTTYGRLSQVHVKIHNPSGDAELSAVNGLVFTVSGNSVNLYKSGTGILQTDNSLTVGGNLSVTGSYGLSASDIPSLAASIITSGTFDIGRIPTGTTSSTVSLGNHTHTGVYHPYVASAFTGTIDIAATSFISVANGIITGWV